MYKSLPSDQNQEFSSVFRKHHVQCSHDVMWLQSRTEGGAGERGLYSDLQSLSELQRRGISHTDDSSKYSYMLQQDGTYGS